MPAEQLQTIPERSRASVLVVEDEAVIRDVVTHLLTSRGGYEVHQAGDPLEARRVLANTSVDLVLLDLMLPGGSGLDLLRQCKSDDPNCEVIMMTAHGSVETAVEAMKSGAFHFLTKPFQNEEVLLMVAAALTQRRLRQENEGLKRELAQRQSGRMIGRSNAMQRVYRMIEQVARSRATVLIQGESGTGKELTAAAIHDLGHPDQPFLTVNSSNIPVELLESQLFGHKRGAFTGADADHTGLLQAASGGSVFFDEISTIPLPVQAKLLRVLQEKEFLPLGSVQPVKVDVRFLMATNEDLEDKVAQGLFREDLFYRLNVITIRMPPLRERRDDIPELVETFVTRYRDQYQKPDLRVSAQALHRLVQYHWPGNVRQLQNAIERMVLLADGPDIGPEHLPPELLAPVPAAHLAGQLPPGQTFQEAVENYERTLILNALSECDNVQRRAAEQLGIKPTTLSEKMKRLGIR